MRVAVTGGTGFIGKRVVRQLLERGHQVVCLVRSPDGAAAQALAARGAGLARGDLGDRASLARAFAGCEGVIHLAAAYELGLVRRRDIERAIAENVEGTRDALSAARAAGVARIVYTSSIAVYGTTRGQVVAEGWRPERLARPYPHPSTYALSKARAHYDVAQPMIAEGAPIVIVQPGAVIGPRDTSSFAVMWRYLARGLPLPLGNARYGMVGVEDCALGHVLALERGRLGECYHLVDENLSLREAARRAAAAAGLRARLWPAPDAMLAVNRWILGVLERVVRLPAAYSSEATRSQASWLTLTVDAGKARRELGWTTQPLDDVLREVVADELALRGRPLPPQLAGVTPRVD